MDAFCGRQPSFRVNITTSGDLYSTACKYVAKTAVLYRMTTLITARFAENELKIGTNTEGIRRRTSEASSEEWSLKRRKRKRTFGGLPGILCAVSRIKDVFSLKKRFCGRNRSECFTKG